MDLHRTPASNSGSDELYIYFSDTCPLFGRNAGSALHKYVAMMAWVQNKDALQWQGLPIFVNLVRGSASLPGNLPWRLIYVHVWLSFCAITFSPRACFLSWQPARCLRRSCVEWEGRGHTSHITHGSLHQGSIPVLDLVRDANLCYLRWGIYMYCS